MVTLLGPGDLEPGDVLLSASRRWHAWLIRWLDDGDFSHAGVYDGERVVSVGAAGIHTRPLYSCEVFRVQQPGAPLGHSALRPDVLLERIRTYLEQPDAYVYTPLYLVGLLMIMRRLGRPAWRRRFVELVGGLLLAGIRRSIERLPAGVLAVTPSELVARLFHEARASGGPCWDILVDPARHRPRPAWLPTSGRFEHLMQQTEEVLTRVNPDLPVAVSQARSAAPSPAGAATAAAGPLAPPCFVSPADLQHSISLVHLGRVVVPRRRARLRVQSSAGLATRGAARASARGMRGSSH